MSLTGEFKEDVGTGGNLVLSLAVGYQPKGYQPKSFTTIEECATEFVRMLQECKGEVSDNYVWMMHRDPTAAALHDRLTNEMSTYGEEMRRTGKEPADMPPYIKAAIGTMRSTKKNQTTAEETKKKDNPPELPSPPWLHTPTEIPTTPCIRLDCDRKRVNDNGTCKDCALILEKRDVGKCIRCHRPLIEYRHVSLGWCKNVWMDKCYQFVESRYYRRISPGVTIELMAHADIHQCL